MADEEVLEEGEEPKKKGGIVKILIFVLLGILLIGITVGATLFMTGFFDPKPVAVDEAGNVIEQLEEGGEIEGESGEGAPKALKKKAKDLPESQQFDQTYAQLEDEFTVNLAESKKFVLFSLGYMTHYDERIVEAVTKHEMALRSAILMEASTYTEDEVMTVAAKRKMTNNIRDIMNEVLENYEGFGGVEEVYFTKFVMQ
jgi:flagellar FliL protein